MCTLRLLGAVFAYVMLFGNAYANFIVDTGAGNQAGGGDALSTQWLAGQFTTASPYILTSVEGWFGKAVEGTATAVIYADNGSGPPENVPGAPLGEELFAAGFTLDNPGANSANEAWDGAYGLSWALGPGTYWLAFEIRPGDTAQGWMPCCAAPGAAPNPLAEYAYYQSGNFGWLSLSSSEALGMRIDAIPLPSAVWLFGSGLLGLVGTATRKKTI